LCDWLLCSPLLGRALAAAPPPTLEEEDPPELFFFSSAGRAGLPVVVRVWLESALEVVVGVIAEVGEVGFGVGTGEGDGAGVEVDEGSVDDGGGVAVAGVVLDEDEEKTAVVGVRGETLSVPATPIRASGAASAEGCRAGAGGGGGTMDRLEGGDCLVMAILSTGSTLVAAASSEALFVGTGEVGSDRDVLKSRGRTVPMIFCNEKGVRVDWVRILTPPVDAAAEGDPRCLLEPLLVD